ncbi:MAG TPA: phytoene/squalene synthase family protein [Caulobacteraceae bacterium]|nr:phytoene/squalene synthase family protein [Caulobacteraceae bacterium]
MTAAAALPSVDLAQSSRATIQKGSKSFAAAAALFDAQTRIDAEMLYAWCRHCDDVIDGQELGHGMAAPGPEAAKLRLEGLYAKTRSALAGEPTTDPDFAAFQRVALARHIPERYALELLDGFAMDVAARRYETLEDTLEYCWHVAGVVGVMMALVMGVKPDDLATLRRAQDLGLAFQLTNISRDVVEDAANGRIYLPAQWLIEAGVPEADIAAPQHRAALFAVTRRVLETAEPYYASALSGLPELPFRSAWAIAAARGVYRQIGVIVLQRGAAAWDTRASASSAMKVWLALQGGWTALASRGAKTTPRPALWSKI